MIIGIASSLNASAMNKISKSSPLIFANASVNLLVVKSLFGVSPDHVVVFTHKRLDAPLNNLSIQETPLYALSSPSKV